MVGSAMAEPPVHPRLRGEDKPRCRSAPRIPSAHPRLRGEDRGYRPTSCLFSGSPRLRGEDTFLVARVSTASGSPPPARGGRCGSPWTGCRSRLTPACDRWLMAVNHGSPPPAQGGPTARLAVTWWWRLTPACAGRTSSVSSRTSSGTAHPRLRGEDRLRRIRHRGLRGSPPPRTTRGLPRSPAHPRLRGEDWMVELAKTAHGGSPPPARGGQTALDQLLLVRRLTPACAGRTTFSASTSPEMAAHPRLRGEDPSAPGAGVDKHGSPPACAGRTSACSPHARSPASL
ncbi:hypothetical protein OK006_10388 [Actinobacteria bacterium OK006]|nr:hypothetical protein OK006_10388 [Actinobacteria bacterium OK006]